MTATAKTSGPNKATYETGHGAGQPAPAKFQWKPGDIEWTKGGKSAPKVSADDGPRVTGKLSTGQKADFVRRLKAKRRKKTPPAV